jgi:DNA processing protein
MIEAPCEACLGRSALIAALAHHIARAAADRRRLPALLALADADLIAAVAGARAGEFRALRAAFDREPARARLAAAGLEAVCRHGARYPAALRELPDAPALLHVAGGIARLETLLDEPAVAVVGARAAAPYGLEVARTLGRGLAGAGVTVISGMALGVDSAAHAGALEVGGPTLAVLAGGADVAYPASKRGLHARIRASGAVVSELPPGFSAHRWCFPARNRLIAALSRVTVVVEAADRSGSLITADLARALGRDVGAVPGPVTARGSAGTNALLFDGAHVVRDAQDVLDLLFGAGVRSAPPARGASGLEPRLRRLLEAIGEGRDTIAALARTPEETEAATLGLAELELLGRVRREAGGRYARVP